ncbi:hypothetical protein ACFRFH_01220 [Leifsonia sp. NPDC056824]|uniref:hypothetical protein n=1 Tax=Leifsonia sp. NPDC056824 TaxID=3345953 RepID=UPI0036A97A31
MKKKLFGGLVALALALAPAAAAHADYPPGDGVHGSLDKYTAAPGETVTYTAPATAYLPGETLTHTLTGVNGHTATTASLRTAPVTPTVGQFNATAEDDGSHTFAFVIPSQAGANYTYRVLRADGTVWESFDISVVNPVIPPGDDNGNGNGGAGNGSNGGAGNGSNGGLAMTGSDIAIAGIAGSAALLVGAGVVLLVVRRRRRSVETAAA